MPRKVKEVLTVVDADVPPHEEEEAPIAFEVLAVPESVKPEEETAPKPGEEKEGHGARGVCVTSRRGCCPR